MFIVNKFFLIVLLSIRLLQIESLSILRYRVALDLRIVVIFYI